MHIYHLYLQLSWSSILHSLSHIGHSVRWAILGVSISQWPSLVDCLTASCSARLQDNLQLLKDVEAVAFRLVKVSFSIKLQLRRPSPKHPWTQHGARSADGAKWKELRVGETQYMGVSKNSGTPKSSILIGFSIINHPFWGTPIFGNTHIVVCSVNKRTIYIYLLASSAFICAFCEEFSVQNGTLTM